MKLSRRMLGIGMLAIVAVASSSHAETPAPRLVVGSSPPVPRIEPDRWIDEVGDYPARALRYQESGSVAVRLFVNGRGRVSGCLVTTSSNSAVLDAATCHILIRRARFQPTESEQLSVFDHVVTWDLARVPVILPDRDYVVHADAVSSPMR